MMLISANEVKTQNLLHCYNICYDRYWGIFSVPILQGNLENMCSTLTTVTWSGGGILRKLRKGFSAHPAPPRPPSPIWKTQNKQSCTILVHAVEEDPAFRTNFVWEKSGRKVLKRYDPWHSRQNAQLANFATWQACVPDLGRPPEESLRACCCKKWASRSKIGLKVRNHKSPLLISFANTIHLPPSVNTNLYRDGMKQLLNQQALVASLEGAYTWASEGGPLFCLAERTSRRRSGELSKAEESPYSVPLLIMLTL